jgi:CheY-like chemotaxis protein
MIAGKVRLNLQPVEVGAVVERAVESVRAVSVEKGIVLTTEIGSGEACVSADPKRLEQIVWNLVANAIEFTDRGGRVDVAVGRSAGGVEIRVRDTGIGIAPGLLPRVFDRFWQADASTSRRHGGLGLGLSIVRHLAELHGGSVSAASAGQGRGATFTVRLPVTVSPRRAAGRPAARPDPPTPSLRGLRALVVDDEQHSSELVRLALEHHGIEVKTATSAPEAFALLEGWAPNVLVSDIAMPIEDGCSLIRRVRAREASRGGRVPALALTVLARAEDRSRALAAGFDGYLAKPVDEAQLLAAISRVAAVPPSPGAA